MEILGLFEGKFSKLSVIFASLQLSLHFCGFFKGASSLSFLISLGTETLSSRKNQVAELCTKLLIASQANGIFPPPLVVFSNTSAASGEIESFVFIPCLFHPTERIYFISDSLCKSQLF